MKIKNYLLLTVTFAMLSLCFNPVTLKAQSTEEAPIDTLAKTVANISDELSKMKRLKITGYIQPQWQYIDSAGAPSVAGGDFINGNSKYYSRFMMRRGRFKFTYSFQNAEMVINTDATEKGLSMRETYVKVTDPWLNMFSLTAGLLQDQFGFELTQSSSMRETPERARFNAVLFPAERDLGVFGTMQFPKTSPMYGLKLDVAAMNGSAGVTPEFDSHKDFTGRLQYAKTTKNEKMQFAVGVSYYDGGYRMGNVKDYTFKTLANGEVGYEYSSDTANYDRKAKRNYIGADFQFTLDWIIGMTTVRGEYIQGQQPGVAGNSTSPKGPATADIYNRKFNGAYFYLIQNIAKSKFQVVVKYDWYDPNTEISGKQIGKTGTNTSNVGDIRFDTYGFGLNYRLHPNIKFTAYYDYVINESTLVKGYANDLKDNVVTIRMQYRF